MADNQINEKTLHYIDGMGLRERVQFVQDPGSASIDMLGVRRPEPEAIEEGVPHPTTYLLDRAGNVQFVDVRENFHLWLDPRGVIEALARIR